MVARGCGDHQQPGTASPLERGEKLRIVGETHERGACVRAVSARRDVYPSLLHYWSRQVHEGRLGAIEGPSFVQVRLAETSPLRARHRPATERSSADTIKIRLPDGTAIKVGHDVSLAALRG
jgi:transposase-like protein